MLTYILAAAAAQLALPATCAIGGYRSERGTLVALTIPNNPEQAARGRRYMLLDGRFGNTGDADAHVTCRAGVVAMDGEALRRIDFRLTPATFRSGDAMLAGLLIEPPVRSRKPPLTVLVHGSESTPSIDRTSHSYLLAAQGIATFVYDKRGAGASDGRYTQNFETLARDVIAASVEAKRLARGRFGRFGLYGGSQGGWVAPLAANRAGAQFVAVGFGIVLTPLEEDAEQVAQELRAKGHGNDVLAAAREVTDATGDVVASHFTGGYERLAVVKARHAGAPWFKEIRGEFTGDVLATPEAELRAHGREKIDNLDVLWRYDAIAGVRAVKAPQLWVLAGEDREAPVAVALDRLRMLRGEGKSIRIALFPDTDHGMAEFVEAPDGTRKYVRITDGFFRMLGDWIKGEWRPPYGKAAVDPATRG